MTVVEKMERYIGNTKIQTSYFGMTWSEVDELSEACHVQVAITYAFLYGRAKGYRAAKADMQNCCQESGTSVVKKGRNQR